MNEIFKPCKTCGVSADVAVARKDKWGKFLEWVFYCNEHRPNKPLIPQFPSKLFLEHGGIL
jgi:hypothetical protein